MVGDVDESNPQSIPDVYFPTCSSKCCDAWSSSKEPTINDPAIVAACMPEKDDCYCAVKSKENVCKDSVVAGVWRKGNAPPRRARSSTSAALAAAPRPPCSRRPQL